MAAEKKVGLVCLEGHFWALNYFCHCDVFLTIKWSFWKCIWMKCKGFISTSESINCRKLPYKYIYYVQNTFWQSGSDSGWFLSIFFKNLNGTRGHPSPLHGKFHSIFLNTSLNYIACSSTKAMEWQASQVEGWTWYFSREGSSYDQHQSHHTAIIKSRSKSLKLACRNRFWTHWWCFIHKASHKAEEAEEENMQCCANHEVCRANANWCLI